MRKIDRTVWQDTFRNKVLDALDKSTKKLTGQKESGWNDQELPALFKGLDVHLESVAKRLEIELTD